MDFQSLITTEAVENGYKYFPPISQSTQSYLRANKKLTYIKVLRKVYYQEEWLSEFFDKSIIRAKQ